MFPRWVAHVIRIEAATDSFTAREGRREEKERKKGKTGRAISVGGPRDRDSTEPNYRVGRCSVLSRGGERNTGQDTPATFLSTTVADILDACSEQPPAVVGRMVVNLSYEACVGSADNRPPLSSVRFVCIYIYAFSISLATIFPTGKTRSSWRKRREEGRRVFSYDLKKKNKKRGSPDE